MTSEASRRAWTSLIGLSVGDAFGERFFGPPAEALESITQRSLPPGRWPYTDDTEMALSIVEVLFEHGTIDQDQLARRFADRMTPERGYGRGAFEILSAVRAGEAWGPVARRAFRGMGSFGNGAAMRVGPIGGFFADAQLEKVADEGRRSAEPTHAHAEGIAGAIAIAVGAALAWRARDSESALGVPWMRAVAELVPPGYTRDAIEEAVVLDPDTPVGDAARQLGNGSAVSAPDTVPLCVWVSAYATSFEAAMWKTVSALGDRDTTCAIVGSMLALRFGRASVPPTWLERREPLPISEPA